MKAFFLIWCLMAIFGLIASFFNPGHIYFTCIPSALMAAATYPEFKQDLKERRDEKRLR